MQNSSDFHGSSREYSQTQEQKDSSFQQFSLAECSILLFVSREKWKEDSEVTHCFNCNSQFIFLLRRKHHCRKCGNIFCGNCSNFFLNTEEIGLQSPEKIARLCGYCYQGTQNYLNLMRKENMAHKTQLRKQQQDTDTIDELEDFNEDSPPEEEKIEKLTRSDNSFNAFLEERALILRTKLDNMLNFMAKKLDNLQEPGFRAQFLEVLCHSLGLVHLSATQKDFMDVCHYVKIKRICEGTLGVAYVDGIITSKNVSDRKMQSFFKNPRILLISPSVDLISVSDKKETDSPVNMESLLQNERKMMKKTVEFLLKLQPTVIFLENSINRLASDMLKSSGVTLFVKTKGSLLRRIARLTRAKVLKSLRNLHRLPEKPVLGTCAKLYTRAAGGFFDSDTAKNKDPTLLYLEGCCVEAGGTIALSGPKYHELTQLKKAMKILLRLGRHVVLEHEIICVEKRMLAQVSREELCEETSAHSNSNNNNNNINTENFRECGPEGNFSCYLDEKLGVLRFMKRDFIHYTKAHVVKALVENYIDIVENPAALSEIHSKKHGFFELCGMPSLNKIYFYSTDDITLGTFILNKVKNLFTRCEREGCFRPRNNHIALYYQGARFVRISVETTGFIKAAALNLNGKFLYIEEKKNSNQRLSSSNSLKLKENSLMSFKTFLFCQDCGNKLTEEHVLQKNYLEYSFTRFLSHFFVDSGKTLKEIKESPLLRGETQRTLQESPRNLEEIAANRENLEETPNIEKSSKKCAHEAKVRVFQYGESLINFSCGELTIYSIKPQKSQFLSNAASSQAALMQEKREFYLKKFQEIMKIFINLIKHSLKTAAIEPENAEFAEKLKPALENLLSKVQFFALSIETSLNSALLANYLEIEGERLQILNNLSVFLELFQQFLSRKNLEFFQQTPQMSASQFPERKPHKNLSVIAKNCAFSQIKPQKTLFSPLLLKKNPAFLKRSLSSNKDLERIEFPNASRESLKAQKSKRDPRFSSNSKPKPQEIAEKISLLSKDLSHFSMKYEKSSDSGSEKDDPIAETAEIQAIGLENPPQLFENCPEEPEFECVSPQIVEKVGVSAKKSSETSDFEALLSEVRALNQGIELSFFGNEENTVLREVSSLQKYKYVPVYENDPVTCVAHALNSLKYLKEIHIDGGFLKCEQEINFLRMSKESAAIFHKLIRSHLEKSPKKLPLPSHFIYKTHIIKPFAVRGELRKEPEESNVKSQENSNISANNANNNTSMVSTDTVITVNFSNNSAIISNNTNNTTNTNTNNRSSHNSFYTPTTIHKKKRVSLSVIVYYAKQFEALRMDNGVLLASFIGSLACSSLWQDNSGGKSKASFIKSFDELYIFKALEKKEFLMFFNYAHSYFDYLWKSNCKKRPSILTKIFGLYEVKLKDSRFYYICMQNLFFGLEKHAELRVYDLKGSETNRYVEKKRKNQTLLDTNFKIDQNGEPFAIKAADKKYLDVAFENDTRFLKKHRLVDYSLLLIVETQRKNLVVGIIDYLREYTWDKKMETMAKKISKGGATPTIVEPEEYRERFKRAMNKYFMEVAAG